jgi:hypothetical protein
LSWSADDSDSVNSDDEEAGKKAPSKAKAAPLVLELNDDGYPILPEKDSKNPMNLGRQKDLVRVFITAHYSELSLTDWKLCEILPLTSTYQGWPVKMQKCRCPGNSYLRTRTNLSKIITSQMSTYRNH